ncbi:hypothetical protein GcM1_204024 [Golovinomyces cichoracearum]|uniref:Uncharacterized protein n=1 Tax=Golovinomyces cichoracearum TaxID=62708 RepID=A0A420IXF6_9PEZI|nr:hypothetical protein GcM1_204024 [Golovinomyces cichoracearum]
MSIEPQRVMLFNITLTDVELDYLLTRTGRFQNTSIRVMSTVIPQKWEALKTVVAA